MARSSIVVRPGTVQRAIFAPFGAAVDAPAEAVEPAGPDPAEELARLRSAAEEDGYADGYARGREEGVRLLLAQAERFGAMLDRATHDVQATLEQLEPQLIELALTVAGRVVERELIDRPELVADVIRSALAAAGAIQIARVRVNPEDHPFLQRLWPTGGPSWGDLGVELLADPSVQKGGCIIDTAAGFVDGQPAARLEELRHQILANLGMAG